MTALAKRPRLPALDASKLADLQSALGGKPDDLRELLHLFVSDALERCRIAQRALASGDLRAVTRAAHAIVGSAGTVGARRLHSLSRALEDAKGNAQAQLRLARLEQELARVSDETRALFGAQGQSHAAPRTPLESPCIAGTSRDTTWPPPEAPSV